MFVVKPHIKAARALDEPSMGLSRKLVDQTWEKIVEMNNAGMTVRIVEQNARKGLSIADHAIILVLGKKMHEDPAAKMLDAYGEPISSYLGGCLAPDWTRFRKECMGKDPILQ